MVVSREETRLVRRRCLRAVQRIEANKTETQIDDIQMDKFRDRQTDRQVNRAFQGAQW